MQVKICGLKDDISVAAAVKGGARYIGFVFFEKSPRYVTPQQAAALAAGIPAGVCKVALVVDPTDQDLEAILEHAPIDMLQLQGSETPARVAEIKARFGLPVMKAIGIAEAGDLDAIPDYASVADQLLIDAKASNDGGVPGGNGVPFDWRLLEGRRWPLPWMLAGGLTPDNVAEAGRLTGAIQVDASSSMERTRGVKDPKLITAFLDAAQA